MEDHLAQVVLARMFMLRFQEKGCARAQYVSRLGIAMHSDARGCFGTR